MDPSNLNYRCMQPAFVSEKGRENPNRPDQILFESRGCKYGWCSVRGCDQKVEGKDPFGNHVINLKRDFFVPSCSNFLGYIKNIRF